MSRSCHGDGHPLIGELQLAAFDTWTRNRGALMGHKWFNPQLWALQNSAARRRNYRLPAVPGADGPMLPFVIFSKA